MVTPRYTNHALQAVSDCPLRRPIGGITAARPEAQCDAGGGRYQDRAIWISDARYYQYTKLCSKVQSGRPAAAKARPGGPGALAAHSVAWPGPNGPSAQLSMPALVATR